MKVMTRFDVLGLDSDRDLIQSLARHLAEAGSLLRTAVNRLISGDPPRKGGILAALRSSPLLGVDLDLTRQPEDGRKIDV